MKIALEPEAAALYCRLLPIEKYCGVGKTSFTATKPATVYMVADLGGMLS